MASKAKMTRVQQVWLGIPDDWKKEFASAWHTFIPAFIGALLFSFQTTGEFSWSRDALAALFLAAFRAGFKALSVSFFSRALPDPAK